MATYFIQNTNNVEDIEQMNNVIDKVNQANTTATSNIGQLTDLNNKATELSNNIQQALPLNSELVKNTESAKVANTNLLTTNQEAVSKNTELQASLEKTKEFIEGLDGSQNIPQIRMDVTKLQNGLKSNQSLAYTGSSISANDTLEGRTEGMKVKGKTMYKKTDGTYTDTWEEGVALESFGEKEGNKISILSHSKNLFRERNFIIEGTPTDKIKIDVPIINKNEQHVFSIRDFKITKPKDDWSPIIGVVYTDGSDSGTYIHQQKFVVSEKGKTIDYFYYRNPWGVGCTLIDVQIEESTKQTDYEHYKEYKKDILIKEPLRSLDENIYDVIQESNGQVIVNRAIGQYTFTGDENIQLWPGTPTDDYCYFVIDGIFNYKRLDKAICNNLPYSSSPTTGKELISLRFASDLNRIYISISKNKLTTPNIDGLKAYFKANLTTMIYPLATPTVEIVENCVDIDLDTYQDKTYFNILNSLPGTLDFKVPSNIGSVVQNMAKEVNNIWDVINNLLVPSLIDINKNVAMSTIKNNLK
ncbi:hypothetical protein ACSW8L_16120 (plasmid) [Clostridium perfringens]